MGGEKGNPLIGNAVVSTCNADSNMLAKSSKDKGSEPIMSTVAGEIQINNSMSFFSASVNKYSPNAIRISIECHSIDRLQNIYWCI